jgi:prevent-host-death family protein
MISVGLFEAKTNLSALIEKVEAGEEIQITRHGKPVAKLVASSTAPVKNPADLIARINRIADRSTLGPYNWKELRDYGRKW